MGGYCCLFISYIFLLCHFVCCFAFCFEVCLVWFGFGFWEEMMEGIWWLWKLVWGCASLPTFYSMGPKIVTKSLGKAFWVEVGMSPSTCFQDCFKLCKGTLSLWIHPFFIIPLYNQTPFFKFSSLIIILLLHQTILSTLSLFNNYVYLNISLCWKNQISCLFPFLSFPTFSVTTLQGKKGKKNSTVIYSNAKNITISHISDIGSHRVPELTSITVYILTSCLGVDVNNSLYTSSPVIQYFMINPN